LAKCLGIRNSDHWPTLLITEFSGLIALGKFENKLNEAGVFGGSAKQEFLGVHFFTNPTPDRQELSHKSLHPVEKGTPFSPTFATPVIVFPLPHFQSRLEMLNKVLPSPLPTFDTPVIVFSPSSQPTGLSQGDQVAAQDARKNPGMKRPPGAIRSLEKSQHKREVGGRRMTRKILDS